MPNCHCQVGWVIVCVDALPRFLQMVGRRSPRRWGWGTPLKETTAGRTKAESRARPLGRPEFQTTRRPTFTDTLLSFEDQLEPVAPLLFHETLRKH
jgi:hypothetical protein